MRITYIYHSSYMVELDDAILLFDYFKGELPELNPEKKLYIFSSHKHGDHFDMKIFRLASEHPETYFILGFRLSSSYLDRHGISQDIRERILFTAPRREYELKTLKIKTLRSTDAGVAYIIDSAGELIYHAGDLNDWDWTGETPEYRKNMNAAYEKEMLSIKGLHFRAAFLPLDPRLESMSGKGILGFMDKCEADFIFPMHMWDDHSVIQSFKKKYSGENWIGNTQEVAYSGEVFEA